MHLPLTLILSFIKCIYTHARKSHFCIGVRHALKCTWMSLLRPFLKNSLQMSGRLLNCSIMGLLLKTWPYSNISKHLIYTVYIKKKSAKQMKIPLMPQPMQRWGFWARVSVREAHLSQHSIYNAHNPTLPLWALIYFQINPLLDLRGFQHQCRMSATRFTRHLASVKQSRAILCRLSAWFHSCWGRLARAGQRRSCAINHCRNTGWWQAKWDLELHEPSGKNSL